MSVTLTSPRLSYAITWEGWTARELLDEMDLPPVSRRLSQVAIVLPDRDVYRFDLWALVEMRLSATPPKTGPEIVISGYEDPARARPTRAAASSSSSSSTSGVYSDG